MLETTNAADRQNSTRRLVVSDGLDQYEITVALSQDRALPDEETNPRPTGEIPQNGALAVVFVALAALLNRTRHNTTLPASHCHNPAPVCSCRDV